MKHPNNSKNNSKVTAAATAKFLSFATTIILVVGVTTTHLAPHWMFPAVEATTEGFTEQGIDIRTDAPKAPMAASEDGGNIYVVWWTNRSGNWEVMFRASTDGGATFGEAINLSNTSNADSGLAEIAAEGDNVIVTWWEGNQTSTIPVARISTDAGETFGPLLMLGSNGTISITEEE